MRIKNSKKIMISLLIIVVVLSFLGTVTFINKLNNIKTTPEGSKESSAEIGLTIIEPTTKEKEDKTAVGEIKLNKVA